MAGLIAASCAAAAVILGWATLDGRHAGRLERLNPAPPGTARPALPWRALFGLGGVGLVGGLLTPWLPIIGLAIGATAVLIAKARREKSVRRRQSEVVGAAMALASLLRVGQLPTEALRLASTDHPVLRPAAATADLGGDVCAALRASATKPGYEGIRVIAGGWSLSEQTGAPVAGLMQAVAAQLQSQERLRAEVVTEVAGARATGRLLAVLPVLGVALGYLGGGDPIDVLFGSRLGLLLCLIGVVLSVIGVFWMERLADRAQLGGPRW